MYPTVSPAIPATPVSVGGAGTGALSIEKTKPTPSPAPKVKSAVSKKTLRYHLDFCEVSPDLRQRETHLLHLRGQLREHITQYQRVGFAVFNDEV